MAWIHEARVNGLGFQKFAQLCLVLICKPQCSRECHVHLLAMDDSVRVCVCVCVCVCMSVEYTKLARSGACLASGWLSRRGVFEHHMPALAYHNTTHVRARTHARTHLDKQMASSRGVLNQRQTLIFSLFAACPESASFSRARARARSRLCVRVRARAPRSKIIPSRSFPAWR